MLKEDIVTCTPQEVIIIKAPFPRRHTFTTKWFVENMTYQFDVSIKHHFSRQFKILVERYLQEACYYSLIDSWTLCSVLWIILCCLLFFYSIFFRLDCSFWMLLYFRRGYPLYNNLHHQSKSRWSGRVRSVTYSFNAANVVFCYALK